MGPLGDPKVDGVYDLADYRTNAPQPTPAYEFWVTEESFRNAFGIDPSVVYTDCSGPVYDNFQYDIGQSYAKNVTYLLEQNIPVLIYSGQDDLIVPTPGTRAWVGNMGWSQIHNFELAGTKPFLLDN
eukprot:CAMPEP_0114596542 /NCGR_PEP_ID=MMETSP0125-20121206/18602_1 /TAXON_ID=485358 ORGANISM="Aristerostoma sp., Strain ATCC 50986" /NCGR_SAMPLE_ID=MMETSP0125 /ASSEMBLY_ACC=CAM_ASM_000245 /LENGTH=126 /DNA_ID=CAMNT_0001799757 /DNA_START=520 /DNA_END=900 /DNA_ORIENTATION=-